MSPVVMAMPRRVIGCLASAIMLAAALDTIPMTAVGQTQSPGSLHLSVVGGPSNYDLSGTGTALSIGTLLPWRPGKPFVVEPGIMFFTYSSQFEAFESRTSYLMPELSLQVQGDLKRVRPFIGVGVGAAFAVSGTSGTDLTLHALGGIRADVSREWGLRGELRVRSVDPWVGTTADFLVGVSRRLR